MPEATADALTGLGMPAQLAVILGANPHSLTTILTAQATAAKVLSRNTELVTASGQTAARIPSGIGVMEPYFFFNKNADTALVFPPVGDTLNGTLNASVSIAQNKACIVYQYKKGFWASILTG
jgi:hypothetical protein